MKAIFKKLIVSLGITSLLLVPAAALLPATSNAQNVIQDGICEGYKQTGDADAADCTTEDDTNSFSGLARRIINIFSIVVGAVSVIMIIIGGFRYIISGGDSNGVTGAKNTIMYAIIGLVIVLFAQIIIRFVISNASGTQ